MNFSGTARQVWIFINEHDHWHGQPLYLAILETLKRNGCHGGTVFRGIASFGIHSLIHTTTLVEVSSNLPVVVTFIDRADRVAEVLGSIRPMVPEGLITVMQVEVVQSSHRAMGPFPGHMTVADVMTRDVAHVFPDTPITEMVALMLERELTALPVVDAQQHLLGIITDGDLLTRGSSELPVKLQRELPPEERAAYVAALLHRPQHAADLMTPDPVTLAASTPLSRAAVTMIEANLKRLPVINAQGQLAGIVSYADLLRTVADSLTGMPPETATTCAGAVNTVGAIMLQNIPTVHRDTPLTDTLDRLLLTDERRVVVVDDQRHPVGIITDGDVMRRTARQIEPGGLRRLAAWFGGGTRPVELEIEVKDRTAASVMTGPVLSITADAPINEAIRRMVASHIKRLPVIDGEGRLIGLVGRAEALAVLSRGVDRQPDGA